MSKTGTVELIDVNEGSKQFKNVQFFKAHKNCAVDFSFCDKNEHIFASADENEIALWDLRNLSERCITIKCKDLLAMEFL